MIADALRLEIEAHAARVRLDNPLLRRAVAGEISPATVKLYLVTLRYLIANTPPNLRRARDRARVLGRMRLAAYYAEKLAEEDGHERWAEEDLDVLRRAYGTLPHAEPVAAAVELNAFLQATIDRDPMLYLSYVLWAECFTSSAGGDLVDHLVARCGVPAGALTCLAKHVELDKDHTTENLDAIDGLVADPRMLDALRRVLHASMGLFDRVCVEIVEADEASSRARVAS